MTKNTVGERFEMETKEAVLMAKVRCICGGSVTVQKGETETCRCGCKIDIRDHAAGKVGPWAVTPDHFDLADRKRNKPEIIKLWWA